MKQYIIKEQLNELTFDEYEKLYKWFFPNNTTHPSTKPFTIPLLSIGQMIEFLDEHSCCLTIENNHNDEDNDVFGWMVNSCRSDREIVKDELCDALWEAVKQVLKKESNET